MQPSHYQHLSATITMLCHLHCCNKHTNRSAFGLAQNNLTKDGVQNLWPPTMATAVAHVFGHCHPITMTMYSLLTGSWPHDWQFPNHICLVTTMVIASYLIHHLLRITACGYLHEIMNQKPPHANANHYHTIMWVNPAQCCSRSQAMWFCSQPRIPIATKPNCNQGICTYATVALIALLWLGYV